MFEVATTTGDTYAAEENRCFSKDVARLDEFGEALTEPLVGEIHFEQS